MNGGQERDGVNAVSDASKSKSPLNTDSVDESSTEETKDGEGTVEGGVLVVDLSVLKLGFRRGD
jgi:hypothetical protein